MAPQRGIYRSWKVTYCVQLELMPQVFAVSKNFVFIAEVFAIGKQFRLIGLEGTLPLMRSKTAAPSLLPNTITGKYLWQLHIDSNTLYPYVQMYKEVEQNGETVLVAGEVEAVTENGKIKKIIPHKTYDKNPITLSDIIIVDNIFYKEKITKYKLIYTHGKRETGDAAKHSYYLIDEYGTDNIDVIPHQGTKGWLKSTLKQHGENTEKYCINKINSFLKNVKQKNIQKDFSLIIIQILF